MTGGVMLMALHPSGENWQAVKLGTSRVRKNIGFRPADQIQIGAHWQEIKTRLRNLHPVFTL